MNFNNVFCCVIIIFIVKTCVSQQNVTDFCITCRCFNNMKADCSGREIQLDDDFWIDLQKYRQMEDINFSYNNLRNLQIIPISLKHLNVSRCELVHLDDGTFSSLSELNSLDLSYNELASNDFSRRVFIDPTNPIPKLFTDLTYLDLSFNDIHSLNQDFFDFLPNVNVLYLNGNPLAVIDQVSMAAISSLGKLTELGLSGCDLETLPEGFLRRHRRLESLDISGNKFTTIPSVLAETTNLEALQLSGNPIEVIGENALSNLKNLQELYLTSMTKLVSIEAESLGGLEALRVLDISSNPRLGNLSPDALRWYDEHNIEKWPPLNELHLNNNNLSAIDSHLLNRWDLLNYIDVSHNPFLCDCLNTWTVTVLVPLIGRLHFDDTADMVCYKPPEKRGLTLKQIGDEKLVLKCDEESEYLDVPTFDSIIFFGVMIGVIITFPIVLIILLLWKKGVFRKFRTKFHEEYDLEFETLDNLKNNSLTNSRITDKSILS